MSPTIGSTGAKELRCSRTGVFANPNNCNKFYQCSEIMERGQMNWQIVEYDCPSGTIWDDSNGACLLPARVNPKPECWKASEEGVKGMRGGVEPMRLGENEVDTSTTTSSTTASADGDLATNLERKRPALSVEARTEPPVCYLPGTYADMTNCTMYYQCLPNRHGHLSLVWRTCPKGKIFDPAQEGCRRSREVNPKPSCWANHKYMKHVIRVDEIVQVIDGQEGHEHVHQETSNEFSGEHHELQESSGVDQQSAATAGTAHIRTRMNTTTTVDEEIHPGEIHGSEHLKGRKTRITIPKGTGPKPLPLCEHEGTFPHPTECAKYIRCVQKGSGPLKLYRFPCTAGTIFDPISAACKEPKEFRPIRPVVECAHWDEPIRVVFEDMLNEETEDAEPSHTKSSMSPTTVSPITSRTQPDTQKKAGSEWIEETSGNKGREGGHRILPFTPPCQTNVTLSFTTTYATRRPAQRRRRPWTESQSH